MQGSFDEEDDSFDFSNYKFPKEKWIIISKSEIAIKIGTFIPIIIFGILNNIILLNIIFRNRALRIPTNLLIANMASADLATLAICPILFMFHDFFQNYQLGACGCKLEGFLEGSLFITAVLNLCAVSYDRLTAIILPSEAKLTMQSTKIVMICTWLIGIVIAIPLAVYRTYKERIWKDFIESYCKEDPDVLRVYWHVLIITLVWFPLSVMIICYSAIFHKLDRYEKKVLKREHPMYVSYKTKVAKTLFIVVVIFVILRVPFSVLVFIRDKMLTNLSSGNHINHSFIILWYTSHYLMFVNAAINPLVYGLMNDNFRRAYHQTPLLPTILLKLFCYHKKTLKTINQNDKSKKVRKGALQPKGPCGEERLAGIKNLFNSTTKETKNDRKHDEKFSSKLGITKSTNTGKIVVIKITNVDEEPIEFDLKADYWRNTNHEMKEQLNTICDGYI